MIKVNLEKIVLFILEQQGLLAKRLSDLREQQDTAFQQRSILDVSQVQKHIAQWDEIF
ncbi:hypothetical protein BVRB_7g162000 [Beta vulgaris subsp. vulgaris]|nr:hypothetical protein BVRB_7g162000 [Beta vulgaris subsp. vulgaris]